MPIRDKRKTQKRGESRSIGIELRMYDGRVGRWMTTDPYSQYFSPYLAMGNNPIQMIDPDGGRSGCDGCPDEIVIPYTITYNQDE